MSPLETEVRICQECDFPIVGKSHDGLCQECYEFKECHDEIKSHHRGFGDYHIDHKGED